MSRPASEPPEDIDDPRRQDVVDPHIRAHIYSLCTALGGPSIQDPTKYELGDEALPVLKDLRQWLRLYDRALNRLDVARCLSEVELVQKDLLEIIAGWKEEQTVERRGRWRVVLACVELMTPLTWALDKQSDQMTVNHHRHIPVLEHAQRKYKQAILQHPSRRIIRNIIRVTLPSLALDYKDREDRDDGIINLILHLLRNITQIEHTSPTEFDTGEEISRSATISAFADQNVFDFLLTLGSGLGDEFRGGQEIVLMETLFHLLKGLDVEAVFRGAKEEQEKMGRDLSRILKVEDEKKRAGQKAATRHNRFGASVWVEREDGSRSFVSGQDALLGKTAGLENIDKSKKWKRSRGGDKKGVARQTELDMKITLDPRARDTLRKFVESFIDAGFNPLAQALRRAVDRDHERLLETNTKQYFFIIAWFLQAERVRRQIAAKERPKDAPVNETDSFSVVAGVLNQEFLIVLQKKMQEWYELKMWNEVQAGMKCFTQIMYTVQDMAMSKIEEDQEIAENIQNRLFYEESTMFLVVDLLKAYTIQPLKWLDDCTEMVHVHLRLLEKYAQQHEHMYIRSRRRAARKRKEKAQQNPDDPEAAAAAAAEVDAAEDAENMARESKQVSTERAFDFERFEHKFMHPKCIHSFVSFLGMYRELDSNQIMRSIKFLHRVVEKRKLDILLCRIDYVDLFYNLMQGPEPLPKSNPAYKPTDEFVKHFFRKLFKKLQKMPVLYVELLFTKLAGSMYFLQNNELPPAKVTRIREAAALEVKPGMSRDEQIGIVVSALLNDDKADYINWLKTSFQKAYDERRSFEDEANARHALEVEAREHAIMEDPDAANTLPPLPDKPTAEPPAFHLAAPEDKEEIKTALYKDGHLRLLLTLLGAEKRDINATQLSQWIISETVPSVTILANLRTLQTHADSPPEFEDGLTAESFIRRAGASNTSASRRRAQRSGDMSSDSEPHESDNEFLADNHLTARARAPDAHPDRNKPKKTRGPRRRADDDEDEDSDAAAERRRLRREHEREKRNQIKSAMWIEDSDEGEDDEEFWRREEELRKNNEERWQEELLLAKNGAGGYQNPGAEDGDDGDAAAGRKGPVKRGRDSLKSKRAAGGKEARRKRRKVLDDDDDEDEDASSPAAASSDAASADEDEDVDMDAPTWRRKTAVIVDEEDEDDQDEDVPMAATTATRPRKRAAVLDSDDDDE